MKSFNDKYGRSINYLRVSVTDRCNLRCVYCMPSEGIEKLECKDLLKYEEIVNIIEAGAGLGLRKIRFTGGEPLVRKDFVKLIEKVNKIQFIEEISMTTNGIYLDSYAKFLKQAGLKRVNISLDTLKKDKFNNITRGGNIDKVFAGIEAAKNENLTPVKINVVVMRGFNDNEILDFVKLSREKDLEVRFIEYMPIGNSRNWENNYMSASDIKEYCHSHGEIFNAATSEGNGPARYYHLKNGKGKIGFISPVSEHFCSTCNRLRLTSDGKIKNCLFSEDELELKSLTYSKKDIQSVLKQAVREKPYKHQIGNLPESKRSMLQIGG